MSAVVTTWDEVAPATSSPGRPCTVCVVNIIQHRQAKLNGNKVFAKKLAEAVDRCERCAERAFSSEAWVEALNSIDI